MKWFWVSFVLIMVLGGSFLVYQNWEDITDPDRKKLIQKGLEFAAEMRKAERHHPKGAYFEQ